MWYFFFIPIGILACSYTDYRSSCEDSDKYTLTRVPLPDCIESEVLRFKSLDCKFSCDPGYYEHIDKDIQTCAPCPAGTFSVSGVQYGGGGIPWTAGLNSMMNDCWVLANEYYIHDSLCGWEVFGSLIRTQKAPFNQSFIATLLIPVKIVKSGVFSLSYKKNTVRLDGKTFGIFSIFINNEQVLLDNEVDHATWKYFEYYLETGMNEVIIEYYIMNNEDIMDFRAEISVLSISGSEYSSKDCYICPAGGYEEGRSTCEGCGPNEYWSDIVCKKCPDDYYSLPGSVGISECKMRKKCLENDFFYVNSGCKNGYFNSTAHWKEPIFCDYKNSQLLIDKINLPCENCEDGYTKTVNENGETYCIPCGFGKYSNYSTQGQCLDCAGGTSPVRSFIINSWDVLPEGFSTYCVHLDNTTCKHSLGWITNNSRIHTDADLITNTTLILSRNFNILSNSGKLTVDYSMQGKDSNVLEVYINSEVVKILDPTMKKCEIYLSKGINQVKFVYNVVDVYAEISIFGINIEGGDEGAASQCAECEDGYFSVNGQEFCSACPAGQSSNLTKTGCESCPIYYFSAKPGQSCQKCITNTINNYEKTNCIGADFLRIDGKNYFLGNITGVLNRGICKMPTAKFYCFQSFYGPLPGFQSDFFISILNPSTLNLPNSEYSVSNSSGFAFMVNKKNSNMNKADISETCISQNQITNIGALATSILSNANGFSIHYTDGDQCTESLKYSTNVSIICDIATGIGWPSFIDIQNCSFDFVWRSKYGCPICKFEDMKTTQSECVDGVRVYKKVTGQNCILPFDEEIEWEETCSEVADAISTWQVILGFCLVGLLVVFGLISCLIYLKYKKSYDRLKEVSDKI